MPGKRTRSRGSDEKPGMRRLARALIVPLSAIAGILAASPSWADSAYAPTEAEANKYSVEQATDYVQRGFTICSRQNDASARIEVMPDMLTSRSGEFLFMASFRDLTGIQLSFKGSTGGFLKPLTPDTLTIAAHGHFLQFESGNKRRDWTYWVQPCTGLAEDWTKVLADTLLRLKIEYDKANSPENLAKFKEQALRYQAMDPKPQIPEDARRFRVQAESAVADKRFLEAVGKYGKAIEIAPWWAEAHFNRAVVLAELQNFDSAMLEMKRYLILRPDAPDARQAQDFIYTWEAYPFKHK